MRLKKIKGTEDHGWLMLMILAAVIIIGLSAVIISWLGQGRGFDAAKGEMISLDGAFAGGGMNSVSFASEGSDAAFNGSWEESRDNGADYDTGSDLLPGNRKFIRTAWVSMETLDYDAYLVKLDRLCGQFGAYRTSDDRSSRGSRYLDTVIRVPDNSLEEFLAALPEGGSVLSQSVSAEDVTLRYTDTEAHRDMLLEERRWLMNAMESAVTIDELITVRDRLTSVNYELESMERQLRTMDNQISYATVYFSLSEVLRFTEEPEGFLERISTGIKENFEDVIDFMKELLIWFVTHLPALIVLSAAASVITVAARIVVKRKRKKNFRDSADGDANAP